MDHWKIFQLQCLTNYSGGRLRPRKKSRTARRYSSMIKAMSTNFSPFSSRFMFLLTNVETLWGLIANLNPVTHFLMNKYFLPKAISYNLSY